MPRLLIGLACVIALSGSTAFAEQIKIGGGGAATSAIFFVTHDSYEEATGDELDVSFTTPAKGLLALEKGEIDVAAAAVPLEMVISDAEKLGVKIDPKSLQTVVIGSNRTRVFLNHTNKIPALSKAQLKSIFTGKTSNWRQVGGKNMPIQVVWGSGTPGQNALFTKEILDGGKVTAKAMDAGDYAGIREYIAKNEGAIGIDPEGFRAGVIAVPETPEIKSTIIAITKGEPSPKVQRLLKFAHDALEDMD